MNQTLLQVEGMSCQHCVRSIEGALEQIGAQGKVDLGSRTVEVTFDENRVSLEQIKEAIADQGYELKS
ncbi:copper ion binding protein [Cohnella boryungensis]|uniref:Copper ion binding protein n=1 Tax=Cohnella boryungensis TaxID=768479 RepID=A0ABV8S5V7_9BACL